MLLIVGGAMAAQMMGQGPGKLEGPQDHPKDYTTAEGLTADISSQANGLTPTRRVKLDEKVQLLQINSRLFDGYKKVGQGEAPATQPAPFQAPPGMVPMQQGPDRLVHLEGENVRVARPADHPLIQADANGHLSGDPDVIQAYTTVRDTHKMAEEALGRPIRFDSPDGKLTVSLDDPRANLSGPASIPTDTSLVFPKGNPAAGRDPDVLSHETGHALLNSQRPQYKYDSMGTTGAVHEAYADTTALTLALRDPDVRKDVLANPTGANLASVVGEGEHLKRQPQNPLAPDAPKDPRAGIRDLSQKAPEGNEAHDASQRYSGAVYHSIMDVQAQLRKEGLPEDEALKRANEIVGGNALRSADFLPVGPTANLEDLARATLKAGDQDQAGKYRSVMEKNFREAGIQVGGPTDRLREAGYQVMGQNPALRVPAEGAANDYVQQNRETLGLPEGVSYQAHQVIKNDRGETFIHYSDGKSMQDPDSQNYLLLAFDKEGKPIQIQDSVAPPPPPPMPAFPGPWPLPEPPKDQPPALGFVA